jgi:hypothetical protein
MHCHWGWGGKLARQQRPGAYVEDRHPTDLRTGPKPLLLDGVDLPEVMRGLGRGPGRARASRASRAVDPLLLEGPLKGAGRGDERGVELGEQFDTDPPASPARVLALELAGAAEDGPGVAWRGSATRGVADVQALLAPISEVTPQGTHGDQWEVEFAGDLGEGLAVEVAADDLLAGDEGDGTRHGWASWIDQEGHSRILSMSEPRGYNSVAHSGV